MTIHNPFYRSLDSFLVAVDCIILGYRNQEIKLLVHTREMEPHSGGLSLMGGFVQEGESVNQAAIRVLTKHTGLENIFMEQVGVYGEVDREPEERVISCAYYALIDISTHDQSLLEKHNAHWVPVTNSLSLIFDHKKMVEDAISILRRKAAIQPIGFNLLPEKFTLTQLQSLYESIYGHPLDKRNFRKRMLGFDYLEKTDEIDKTGSKKGAYFYKYKEDSTQLSSEYGSSFYFNSLYNKL